jgi:phosphatidylserine decarboxylase
MTKNKVLIFDRQTKKLEEEKICAKSILLWLYKKGFWSHLLAPLFPLLSKLYALFVTSRYSRRKIKSFIFDFHINQDEFLQKVEDFGSFNDFFIRKLKSESRPIDRDPKVAILPADGRCLAYPNLDLASDFYIKGQKFNLVKFLNKSTLYPSFEGGSLALIRLAPLDYHRFHFPFDCIPQKSLLINGPLFSVNPLALRENVKILYENKRVLTMLKSPIFDEVLFVEIGATLVGSIKETFIPENNYQKGEEKGYFSFGGSSIALLFQRNKIVFAQDLIENSKRLIETKVQFGQVLGFETSAHCLKL